VAKYTGIIKQSRTLDLAAITGVVGAALATLPQLQALISPEQYGMALLILSLWQAYLRAKTTGPIGSKPTQPGNDDDVL
jgi:hypothetical protein